MAIYRAADLSYQTWQQGANLLQPLTEKLPVTTTISIIAFTILGFQYFAINLYNLIIGGLITGLSYTLMHASYQTQNQDSFLSNCKKSLLQTRDYIGHLSNKPTLRSPLAPLIGTVSFLIFSYFAFSFIYRISMGTLCFGISSALFKGVTSQEKGLVTFFSKNVASIWGIYKDITDPILTTSQTQTVSSGTLTIIEVTGTQPDVHSTPRVEEPN